MILTLNRRIITKLPHTRYEEIIAPLTRYEPTSMISGLPVIWKKASGHSVWDIFGNKYIDFTSTIFVTNAGHGAVAKAIQRQAKDLIHSYTFPNLPRINLIKELRDWFGLMPNPKIYLASAGSEVTDWAIKLMRHHGKKRNKDIIISFEGSFHGKVGDAAKLSDQELRLPLPESDEDWVKHKKQIEKVVKRCCGIMIESYQGWNAKFFPLEYMQNLLKFCKKYGILICFDEIQGGFYRTGMRFAFYHYLDFVQSVPFFCPDLICAGKALGGGFPISALVAREDLFKGIEGMSSTHSATPLACAAALESLKILNNLTGLDEKIDFMKEFLVKLSTKTFGNMTFNGNGFLWGLIFKNKKIADAVCYECMRNGLLVVRTGRESVKIGPPLTISKGALKEGLCVLEKAINKIIN